MRVKTEFWDSPIDKKHNFIINMCYLGFFLFGINLVYNLYKGQITLIVMNIIPMFTYVMVISSYNKWSKNNGKRE